MNAEPRPCEGCGASHMGLAPEVRLVAVYLRF